MDDEFRLILSKDEALELAAVLGILTGKYVCFDILDRLTDMFPGDIENEEYKAMRQLVCSESKTKRP